MKKIIKKYSSSGLTLIELVLVIVVMATLATVTFVAVGDNVNATKYEQTRQRMEAIRVAILGDRLVDPGGHKTHFGYHGDMGQLPTTLTDLVAIGTQAAWAYDATNGFGAGWRGPYISSEFTTGIPVTNDMWNNAFIYDTSGTATLKSYAADNASGGSGYNTDLVLQILPTDRFATVRGVLTDGQNRWASTNVTIAYPAAGAITTATTATDSLGAFSFTNIPWGIRSIAATATPTIGPNRIIVDKSDVTIAPSTLDYAGTSAVSYVSGSAALSGGSFQKVDFNVTNTYPSQITAAYITPTWTNSTYLTTITFDLNTNDGGPKTQNVPNLSSGNRFDAGANSATALTINPGKTVTIEFVFATNADGTGTPNMSDVTFNIDFEWSGISNHDAISFMTP